MTERSPLTNVIRSLQRLCSTLVIGLRPSARQVQSPPCPPFSRRFSRSSDGLPDGQMNTIRPLGRGACAPLPCSQRQEGDPSENKRSTTGNTHVRTDRCIEHASVAEIARQGEFDKGGAALEVSGRNSTLLLRFAASNLHFWLR